MRKEILFAIIAGVIFGVVIAFGVWRANSAIKNTEGIATVSPATTTSSPTPIKQEFGISLANPEENDVLTQTPTLFSGITKPSSWIVISAEEDDYIIKSDEQGEFSQEVELVGGANQINLTAFSNNGESAEKKIIVVFSTEFESE
jgi:hypothetical protein